MLELNNFCIDFECENCTHAYDSLLCKAERAEHDGWAHQVNEIGHSSTSRMVAELLEEREGMLRRIDERIEAWNKLIPTDSQDFIDDLVYIKTGRNKET